MFRTQVAAEEETLFSRTCKPNSFGIIKQRDFFVLASLNSRTGALMLIRFYVVGSCSFGPSVYTTHIYISAFTN
jgi:hypothetical protein